ncbi:uncharacterized protein LOC117103530 [Anneissia japonica]|uniref:uncharacterized protein LOC117103530 n=1 Tax=Anneissia japonica TaxID=1529436 RepID=UPI00142560FB|nr:uncharacterized protein LOC117103530 [Anneissia japonica]
MPKISKSKRFRGKKAWEVKRESARQELEDVTGGKVGKNKVSNARPRSQQLGSSGGTAAGGRNPDEALGLDESMSTRAGTSASSIGATPNEEPGSSESCSPTTASQRKLASSRVSVNQTYTGTLPPTVLPSAEGFRLVDMEDFQRSLENVHRCRNAKLDVIETGQRNGLHSQFIAKCKTCGKSSEFETSTLRTTKLGRSFEVNRRAAYAMSELGLGREAMVTICSIFNMPPPPNPKSWADHVTAIHSALHEEVTEELRNAGSRLREKMIADQHITDSDQDDPVDVMVTFDGTWQKRGHSSNFGVGVAISVDTGEILDVEICSECQKWEYLKGSNIYDEWKASHEGNCLKNYDGSSHSMEVEAAKRIWSRSIDLHQMRYKWLVSDGDAKTLSALNAMKPYGDDTVEKLDCINHVHKRLGTNLRNLRKTEKT